jgi:hypothetical protein
LQVFYLASLLVSALIGHAHRYEKLRGSIQIISVIFKENKSLAFAPESWMLQGGVCNAPPFFYF